MTKLKHLLEQNQAWANRLKKKDPNFFLKLAELQAPEYLWIGCSDSRVSADQIVDLLPGELFVHRNIANIVVENDLNCLSVIQYAVEVLKVKHIIVCGHYGCGGIKAAFEGRQLGLGGDWLKPIKEICHNHAEKLNKLGQDEKISTLCELNVIQQVNNVYNTSTVQNAKQQGQDLSIHGWIYDLKKGTLKDLNTTVTLNETR